MLFWALTLVLIMTRPHGWEPPAHTFQVHNFLLNLLPWLVCVCSYGMLFDEKLELGIVR